MWVVFSGGRGYHIHVRDPNVIGLESPERREIVDYITATGLEIKNFLYDKEVTGDVAGTGRRKTVKSPRLKKVKSGWGRRIHKGWLEFLDDILHMDENRALEEIKKMGEVGETRARKLLKAINNESSLKKLKEGILDQDKGLTLSLWKNIINKKAVRLSQAHPDEPVTADTKRLIRLPTSLHGGTGFQVTPLTLDTLKDFNPLRDAVVFGDESVRVNVIKASNVEIKGEEYRLRKGKQNLPEHLAVFLMCRGAAEYEP
ncbi:MAG: DNA primase small subunit domain-containing protein [Candidatus Methanospirareceae archaeon]